MGVNNGIDVVVRASQLAREKYIAKPQEALQAPTRCFVSLDLKNTFNKVSWDKIFEITGMKYPELMPLVTLLYMNLGTVYSKMVDGKWHTQTMDEGVNQGYPLSST